MPHRLLKPLGTHAAWLILGILVGGGLVWAWPSQDAVGTPSTVAIVKPDITCATALARFWGPIRWAATSAATPK